MTRLAEKLPDTLPINEFIQRCEIRKLTEADVPPFDLLLLADETRTAIEKYIRVSDTYVMYVRDDMQPIAVWVLHRLNDTDVEIKNIAVVEKLQGIGIGSWLLKAIKLLARAMGYRHLWVGTADTGYRQQRFYERNGFVPSGIRKNFFIENYPEPIYENGMRLKDMMLFKTTL